MHEAAIAKEICTIVLAEAKKHKKKKVKAIKLLFGELTSVVPEAMKFAMASMTQGTIMEGCSVSIKMKKVKVQCSECGKKYAVKDLIFLCPACKGIKHVTITGKELSVESIEME